MTMDPNDYLVRTQEIERQQAAERERQRLEAERQAADARARAAKEAAEKAVADARARAVIIPGVTPGEVAKVIEAGGAPTSTPAPDTELTAEARKFKPEAGWKPVEWSFEDRPSKNPNWDPTKSRDDRPTVYVDKEGTRHYTPWSSMWKAGYKTNKEYYAEGGNRVVIKDGKEVVEYVKPGGGRISNPELWEGGIQGPYIDIGGTWPEGGVHITKKEFETLQELKGERQFKYARKLGLVPDDAVFEKGEGNDWGYSSATEKAKQVKERIQNTQTEVEFQLFLKSQPAELRKAYEKGGYDEYVKAAKQYRDKQIDDYVGSKEYKTLPLAVKKHFNPDDLTDFNFALQIHNLNALKEQGKYKAFQSAMDKMESYGEKPYGISNADLLKADAAGVTFPPRFTQAQITRYMIDHPGDTKTLEDAGFTQDSIRSANGSARLVTKTLDDLLTKKLTGGESLALGRAFTNAGFKSRTDHSPVNIFKNELSQAQQVKVVELYVGDKYKGAFTSSIATVEHLGEKNLGMSLIFTPMAIIGKPFAKSLVGDKVTFLDWGIAAGTGALLFAGGGTGLSSKVLNTLASAGLGTYSAVETVKNWERMNNTQRATSVIFTTLLLAPVLAQSSRAVKSVEAKLDPAGATAKTLIKAESRANHELGVKIMKTYGPEVYDDLMRLNKAQSKYVNELASAKGRDTTTLRKAALDLENAAKKYTDGLAKASENRQLGGFDSPAIKEEMARLSKEIVRNTKAAYEGALPTKTALKATQRELDAAVANLKKAQNKWPTQPDKWADLAIKVAEKEIYLKILKSGELSSYTTRIQRADAILKDLENRLGKAKTQNARAKVFRRVTEARNEALRLRTDYDKNLRSLEVEYGRGGDIGRGGRTQVTTQTVKPLSPRMAAEYKRMGKTAPGGSKFAGGGAAVARLASTVTEVRSTTIPDALMFDGVEVRPGKPLSNTDLRRILKNINKGEGKPKDITDAELKALTKAINKAAAETAGQTSAETQTRISEATRSAIQKRINAAVEPAAQSQPASQTKPATQTKTGINTPFKPPEKPPKKIPPLKSGASDVEKRAFIQKAEAAFTFRRGELGGKDVWHTWALAGGGWKEVVVVGKIPEGARPSTGPGSAYRSIQKLGKGKLPAAGFFSEGGAIDARVNTAGGRPKIEFIQDRQLLSGLLTKKRTQSSMQNLKPHYQSTKRGKIFRTKVRGGTLYSRRRL